jgi:hypothetical protein
MKFNQKEDGSCDLEFSWKERLILLKKGKLHFTSESFKDFGNVFIKIVFDWQLKFNDDIKNKITRENKDINLK